MDDSLPTLLFLGDSAHVSLNTAIYRISVGRSWPANMTSFFGSVHRSFQYLKSPFNPKLKLLEGNQLKPIRSHSTHGHSGICWFVVPVTSESHVGNSMPSTEDKKSIDPVFTCTDPNIVMRSGAGSYLLYYSSSVSKTKKGFTEKP